MRELALFTGVGGGLLGGRLLGWRSVCYVENNAYCTSVLKARIAEGYLCDAPIWDDIKTFDGRPWAGCVDVVSAGFPCQPFSVAGKRKGKDDSRNMWPETIRVIREVRPRYAFCENVPGLISGDHGYFGRILDDLSQSGYDARWRIVSAADVGAPHIRKRLWILAYSNDRIATICNRDDEKAGAKYVSTFRNQDRIKPALRSQNNSLSYAKWPLQPLPERMANGVPAHLDRLKAIGNAQVPAVVRLAWELLNEGGAK